MRKSGNPFEKLVNDISTYFSDVLNLIDMHSVPLGIFVKHNHTRVANFFPINWILVSF